VRQRRPAGMLPLPVDVRCWVMDQRALQNAAKVSGGRRRW
jgi:hypothetical protein